MRFSLDQEIVDKPVDVFIIRRCFRRDEPFRGLIRGKKQYFPQFRFVVKKKYLVPGSNELWSLLRIENLRSWSTNHLN